MVEKEEQVFQPEEKQQRHAKWIVLWIIIVIVVGSGAAIGVNWWMNGSDETQKPSNTVEVEHPDGETNIPVSSTEQKPIDDLVEEPSYQPALPVQDVPILYQNPVLPAGCEATAVAMLLQAYGYEVSKEEVADALPKSTFEVKDGRTYAAHPNEAYVGSPFSSSGFGVFAKAAAETAQTLIDAAEGQHRAVDITGASEEELLQYIDDGVPVCVWATMWMSSLINSGEWYIKDGDKYTDELYVWPGGEHCLVLIAYNEGTVTVHDPLNGISNYDRALFFQRYREVGQYAMILEAPATE